MTRTATRLPLLHCHTCYGTGESRSYWHSTRAREWTQSCVTGRWRLQTVPPEARRYFSVFQVRPCPACGGRGRMIGHLGP